MTMGWEPPHDGNGTESPGGSTLPAVYVGHLLELVHRFGITDDEILSPLAIDPAVISDPAARLPLSVIEQVFSRASLLTGEPGLGIYLGLSMRPSWHGHLGFATMTASNVREAIELGTRFLPTRTTAFGLSLEVSGVEASLVIEEKGNLGRAREPLMFAMLVGLAQVASALTDVAMTRGTVDFAFPEPPYFARFRHVLHDRARFGQPSFRLAFQSAILEFPLKMADTASLRLATEQCERELQSLGFDGLLAGRVRALLGRNEEGFLDQEQVASALAVSVRTLKRRLANEGTTFTALLEDARRARALLLLHSDVLTVDQIATKLGYADGAAFSRAFTRWTGKTPGSYRRERTPERQG